MSGRGFGWHKHYCWFRISPLGNLIPLLVQVSRPRPAAVQKPMGLGAPGSTCSQWNHKSSAKAEMRSPLPVPRIEGEK